MGRRSLKVYLFATALLPAWVGGCGTRHITDTPRTATEQLLVAAAVEQAVSQLNFEFLEDRKVFLDDSLVNLTDKSFVISEVRARARQAGIIFVDQRDAAHYIMELRAGAAGTDRNEYILGIPASQIPTFSNSVGTPELPVYKSVTQTGACHVGFVAYSQDDGRFFYLSGPAYGFSNHKSRWVMGAGPGTKDNIAPQRTVMNTASIKQQPVSVQEEAITPE